MKQTYVASKPFDYSQLKARTAELGVTNNAVARAAKMTPSTYSLKINGKGVFTQEQMCSICDFLHISYSDISKYFFAV